MAVCSFGSDYTRGSYTLIDNLFLLRYLPDADAVDVKVYLYGLTLAATESGSENNHTESISLALGLSNERIDAAFRYWEEKGLVTVTGNKIVYRSPKAPVTPTVKLNASDYATFVEECARVFPEKTLSENELLALIETIREYKIEPDAMLMTMKYCVDSRAAASVPYVLTVAKDWANKGVKTVSAVESHISELENNREEMRQIFAALGKKSSPALDDRLLYLKWREETGYTLDVILTAARSLKRRGGMEKLDRTVAELKASGVKNALEAESLLKEKQKRYDLAEAIAHKLGTSYADYDSAVTTFLTPWLQMGFDDEALMQIAAICFVKNVRSLDGMGRTVKDFYKLGLLNAPAIVAYVDEQVRLEDAVREVLAEAGASSYVTPFDRGAYRTFVGEWGFEHEDVLRAARATAGRPFPFQRLNKLLGAAKAAGITGGKALEDFLARNDGADSPTKGKKQTADNHMTSEYTAEQLNGLFLTLEEDHL